MIHQGFGPWGDILGGTNALLRKRALEDIATAVREEQTGIDVPRYIQDRTVIEDTESSVDLVHRGWGLFNYPARLSYARRLTSDPWWCSGAGGPTAGS